MLTPQCRWKVLMIWNNTGLIGLRMDAMHEDNNLLFSTSDVAKILAFSKMVEQALGKKIEHENDTPEKEQSQEHGQGQERQADARGWSDYPATPEV